MEDEKLLHEFMKNALERGKVTIGKYKGLGVIDIRSYYKTDNAGKDWKPTKKGISMNSNHIPELKKAMDNADKEWKKTK
ncbi:transcriptional coactivator p15/PC4 family protein [Acidobacteriota bacterium]